MLVLVSRYAQLGKQALFMSAMKRRQAELVNFP